MPLLNVSILVQPYLDAQSTQNPLNLLGNVKYSLLGMPTGVPRMVPISLAPNETQSFANTSRTISYNGSTSFSITQVTGTDHVRLVGSYGARTARTYGNNTTQWTVSLTNTTARLTYTTVGTAPNFSTFQIGDGLTIENGSAFNPLNWGDFVVTNVGANYVEYINAAATGETVISKVAVYSPGPVQIGDALDLHATQFSEANQGTFSILRVTDTYVEYANPSAVAQNAVTGVTANLSIYADFYNWMCLATDYRALVQLNGDDGSSVEVEPPTPGDLTNAPGLMLKRGRVFRVDVTNLSAYPLSGFVLLST